MSFDWKNLVGTLAPTIASTFGTPLAGLGVKALLTAFGITPSGNQEQDQTAVEAKIAGATPQELMLIKTSEQQFKKDMKALDIDIEKINAEDRASARQMQLATKSWAPPILATVVTVGFFGILGGILSKYLSTADSPEMLLLIGSLTTAFGMIISFYFGSSFGSQNKDATIRAVIGGR